MIHNVSRKLSSPGIIWQRYKYGIRDSESRDFFYLTAEFEDHGLPRDST